MQRKTLIFLMVAAILAAGGGATALYIEWFGWGSPDDTPPVAPTLQAEAASNQVVYRIDPTQSEVRYEVDEIFLSDSQRNTAIGTTHGVAGDILLDFDDPAQSQVGTIVINVEQFESDSSMRDRRIRQDYLESSAYPEATFIPMALLNFPENPEPKTAYAFQMTGDLTIKATTQPTTWEVTATLDAENRLVGTATTTTLMSDFEVGPISIAGFVETEDEVKLTFDFVALPVIESADVLPQN
jgi:polyisoprenoid-binding protein YceI